MRWLLLFTIASVLTFFIFSDRFSRTQPVPEPVRGFFSWAEKVNSFRAESVVFDAQQRQLGVTTFYFQDPDRWEMTVADDGIVTAQWRFVDNTLYVRDLGDGNFIMDASFKPVITSSVDFRSWVKEAKAKKFSKRFVWQRSESCGETQCWVYVVRDPTYETGRETIRHRLWVTQDTQVLFREEYIGDTGTTITEYSEFNQVSLEPPALVQPVTEGIRAYLVPGRVMALEAARLEIPYSFVAHLR